MDWEQAEARLRQGIVLALITAALSGLPAFSLTDLSLLAIPAIFALVAALVAGLRYFATRQRFIPLAIGGVLLGGLLVLAMPFFVFIGGGIIFLSPLALLDDSPNYDGHVERALLTNVCYGLCFLGTGLLCGGMSWQQVRTIWLLKRSLPQEEGPAH